MRFVSSWIVGCALATFAAAGETVAPPVAALIADLGSPDFARRERATAALWRLGESARPALTAALRDPDAEVAERARQVLVKFAAGNYPDTPPDVLVAIRGFKSGEPAKQEAAVTLLVRLGPQGAPKLRALLTGFLTPEQRPAVSRHLAYTLRRELPARILAGELDGVEALLAVNTFAPTDEGMNDYAVFLRSRGRLPSAIAEVESREVRPGPAEVPKLHALVFLYRAAGRKSEALAAARKLVGLSPEFHEALDALLEDAGEWDALAARTPAGANSFEGLKAFRLRLAGKEREAAAILDTQAESTNRDTQRSGTIDAPTLALLLNGRVPDGVARLQASRNAPQILADVLAAQMKFGAALDLLDDRSANPEGRADAEAVGLRPLYGSRRGRVQAQLGQRDAAAKTFVRAAAQIFAGGEVADGAIIQLVRAEVRSGRPDLACEHLGRWLGAAEEGGRGGRIGQDPFELIFDADAEAAAFLWATLRAGDAPRGAGEAPRHGETMTGVRRLLTGTASAAERERALKLLRAETPAADAPRAVPRALTVASVLRAAGQVDGAIDELARVADRLAALPPDSAEDPKVRTQGKGPRGWVFGTDETYYFWVELADLLTDRGRHDAAAARLMQGARLYPDNPILLDLAGRAAIRAGDVALGKRRLEAARLVPLGNARMRGRYLEELLRRGHLADARRERDVVRECAWLSEMFVGNVWNQVGRASLLTTGADPGPDFGGAASASRKAIHYLLRQPGLSYIEGYAYLTVPQSVRGLEARGLVAAGRVDAGLKVARECLAVTPGASELVIGLVPELEKADRRADAEALFRLPWDAYGALLKAHPESAWAKNAAAWLAAGCQRELDAALTYARAAVAAEPDLRTYRETLAEVHFRRGEREAAVTLTKQLLAEDPRNFATRRQLDRYKTGDPHGPLPESDD